MCKKVAQLTRVIFYLNTKNDDYENNLKAVVNAYEHELDNSIKEVFSLSSRPTLLLPSTRTQQTRPIKILNSNSKLKKFRTPSKRKKTSLISNFRDTNVLVRNDRPNKTQKRVES